MTGRNSHTQTALVAALTIGVTVTVTMMHGTNVSLTMNVIVGTAQITMMSGSYGTWIRSGTAE